jgi:hypothetical protein
MGAQDALPRVAIQIGDAGPDRAEPPVAILGEGALSHVWLAQHHQDPFRKDTSISFHAVGMSIVSS